jgi:hypothetical protein
MAEWRIDSTKLVLKITIRRLGTSGTNGFPSSSAFIWPLGVLGRAVSQPFLVENLMLKIQLEFKQSHFGVRSRTTRTRMAVDEFPENASVIRNVWAQTSLSTVASLKRDCLSVLFSIMAIVCFVGFGVEVCCNQYMYTYTYMVLTWTLTAVPGHRGWTPIRRAA